MGSLAEIRRFLALGDERSIGSILYRGDIDDDSAAYLNHVIPFGKKFDWNTLWTGDHILHVGRYSIQEDRIPYPHAIVGNQYGYLHIRIPNIYTTCFNFDIQVRVDMKVIGNRTSMSVKRDYSAIETSFVVEFTGPTTLCIYRTPIVSGNKPFRFDIRFP